MIQSDSLVSSDSVEPHGDFGDAGTPDTRVFAKPAKATQDAAPTVFDQGSATVASMDEYSTTYVDKNGVKQTQASATPIHVLSDGKWVDASADLSDDGKSGLVAKLSPLAPVFAGKADASKLLSVTRGGHTLSFGLRGAVSSSLEHPVVPLLNLGSNLAKYSSVLPNLDLSYAVSQGGVKESMVLKKAPSSKTPTYSWTMTAPGLAPVKDQFGDLEFLDESGVTVFTIPVPTMWDSSGKDGESQSAITNVDYDVTTDSVGRFTLTLRPDAAWLRDSARVYPVILDPTVAPGADNIHSYKSDGTINNGQVWIGNSHQSGSCCNWRTVTHYNYEQLFGYQVTGSKLYGTYVSGTTTTQLGSVWWANAFSYGGAAAAWLDNWNVGSSGWSDGNIGAYIANWVQLGQGGAYLGLLGNECSCYSYKALNTALYIDYLPYSSVSGVTAASPQNGVRTSTMPIVQGVGNDTTGYGLVYKYSFTSSDGGQPYTTPNWLSPGPFQVPQNNALTPGKHYTYSVSIKQNAQWYSQDSTRTASNAAWSFVTDTPAPTPPQSQSSPADQQVVTTTTPTFSAPQVVDPDGDAVKYQFRLATGADNRTGAISTSPWITPTGSNPVTWTPPVGTLQDGGSYTYTIYTNDGISSDAQPSWTDRFTVNLRIGTSGPSPTDVAGPVTVNLANGNANLTFASPTVATVGGPMGLSFAYNSLTPADKYKGLTAAYYNALDPGQSSTTTFSYTGAAGPRTPLLTRTDPNISFNWGTGSPAEGVVGSDYFLAKWTGFIKAPSTGGPYTFGTNTDDGVRLYLNSNPTPVINQWVNGAGSQWASGSTSLPASPVPFEMDYYENQGSASATLYAKGSDGVSFVVPSDWFTTTYVPLPVGWTSSSPIIGSASRYASAQVTESAVVVTDITGTAHTYSKQSAGGYSAPAGEYGVLALDANGLVTLTDADGVVTAFNAQGRVASTTSPADAKKPATPIATYDPTTGRLVKLSDPVSSNGATPPVYSREVSFVYSDGNAGTCPTTSGAVNPVPAGLLCQIVYPGHTTAADTTQLFYNSSSQLVRILDPGAEQTDFGYDANGRLKELRDPTTNDWLVAGAGHAAASTNEAQVGYDSAGRVSTVTLPAPDGTTASKQPQKSYCYPASPYTGATAGTTFVDQAGLDLTGSPIGHAEKVTYDTSFRSLTVTSALGVTASQSWSNQDQQLAAVDAAGHESTTLYDPISALPTDGYGPAPSSCFPAASANANSSNTDRTPTGTCAATGMPVAHSSTGYDQGLHGLNATYYNNQYLAGVPSTFNLGLLPVTGATVAADGSVNADWGTGAIAPGLGVDTTSLRLTGTITFPGPGTYKLDTVADDGTRIWLNDVNVLDDWIPQSATLFTGQPFTINSGDPLTRRIRLDYFEVGSTASLKLEWEGGSIGATPVVVPGSALAPNYGLSTSSHTDDSAPSGYSNGQVPSSNVTTGYGSNPWLGTPTTTAVDPSGLNIVSTVAYESPGSGWLRKTSQTQPANVGTTDDAKRTTFAYWGDAATSTSDIPCVPTGTPQVGFLKSSTDPAPASGSAITTNYVYDLLGRLVGTKQNGDSSWSCTTYDARGRATQQTYPAFGGAPARTVTNNYAVGGNPLATSVSDASGTISTVTDLLGRPVTSTDALGSTTATQYADLTGRVTLVTLTPPSGAASTRGFTYDTDGKVLTEAVDGAVKATASYGTAAQLLQSVAYANGTSLASIDYGPTGTTDGLTWAFPSGQANYHDQVTRSQSGRILADTVTDGSTVSNSTYTFDAAGRLTQAVIPGHTLSYGFGAASCGAQTAAGADGNRTGFSDAHTVAGVTSTSSTSYCYDNADRLTGTSVTNPPSGANPVAGSNLTTTGPNASLAYDAHGNTTTLADQTLGYDDTNRHLSTTLTDGTTVTYQRDALDRIIKRTATTPAVSVPLAVDAQVSADSEGGWGTTVTSPGITTTGSNELLVAMVSADGSGPSQSITVAGGGLTWTRAVQSNQTRGDAEIWTATAASPLSGVTVSSTNTVPAPQSLTIIALAGAGGVGATGHASLTGAPRVSLTTTAVGSMVFGVGEDTTSSAARTLGSGQTLLHEDRVPGAGGDFWAQRITATTAAAGSTATVNDTAPTTGGWNLAAVEIVPPAAAPVAIDAQVSSVDTAATGTLNSPAVTTNVPGDVLVALVSADSDSTPGVQQATVTGAGLSWSLVARENGQQGDAEVWTATAPSTLTNAVVTSTLPGGYVQSLTVVAVKNAVGIGASAHAYASTGAPKVSVTTTRAGSMVFAAGSDWDGPSARTVVSGQTLMHEDMVSGANSADFWAQRTTSTTATAGSVVQIKDSAPTNHKWDLAAVEVIPAAASGTVSIDTTTSVDAVPAKVVSPPITTTTNSETLVAFVSVDGWDGGGTATLTGAGLTWSLVARETGQPGDVEIWTAHATAPLIGATVTAAMTNEGGSHSLTVIALSGAAGVGASAHVSGFSSAPTVSLTTTAAGSIVFGVGNDKDTATPRTLNAGQTLIHEDSDTAWGEDYWVQRLTGVTSAAGTTVSISDTAPTSNDQWNLAAVEVVPTTSMSSTTTVTEYAYGDSDSPWAELGSSGAIEQRNHPLPGGAIYSEGGNSAQWLYSDRSGNGVIVASDLGSRGTSSRYDPFGQLIAQADGSLSTSAADDAVPDTDKFSDADFGWAATHFKLTEHQGDVASVEMGSRQYLPVLGRFVQVDPVAGGNSTEYNYPNDPINSSDFSGNFAICGECLSGVLVRAVQAAILALGSSVARSQPGTVPTPAPSSKPKAKTKTKQDPVVYVYRIWGGASQKWGASWTPMNPMLMDNPREQLALPDVNTGEYLTIAQARTLPNQHRPALPLDGHAGGAPEWLYYNSSAVLEEVKTVPVNY